MVPFSIARPPSTFPSISLLVRARKALSLRQAIEALLKTTRKIILPALAAQAAPHADLLHGEPEHQHVMHQRDAVGAEFMLDAIEPQHGAALPLGDRLARYAAIDIFARRIDGARTTLGLLPVVLKCAAAAILRLVDLMMAVQPRQRIVADRTQPGDLLAGFERERIVDLDRGDFRIQGKIARSSVVRLGFLAKS